MPSFPLVSTVFDWTKLAVTPTPVGERRDLVDSPTATFTNFEGHATTLRGGQVAHPAHRHPDEELIVVKEGTLEVTINDHVEKASAGSVVFFASNDLHGMRNAGETQATYFVFRFITKATPRA